MEYKGYEIKEEILDWLIDLAITNQRNVEAQEKLTEEVHEIKRIGNYIGFRRTLVEENVIPRKLEPCKNGIYL